MRVNLSKFMKRELYINNNRRKTPRSPAFNAIIEVRAPPAE